MVPLIVIDSLDQLTTDFSLKQYSAVHVIRSTRHFTCEHKQRMFEEIVAVQKISRIILILRLVKQLRNVWWNKPHLLHNKQNIVFFTFCEIFEIC